MARDRNELRHPLHGSLSLRTSRVVPYDQHRDKPMQRAGTGLLLFLHQHAFHLRCKDLGLPEVPPVQSTTPEDQFISSYSHGPVYIARSPPDTQSFGGHHWLPDRMEMASSRLI